MPMSQPPNVRKYNSEIHTVSRTPSSVSSNLVLDQIIPGIVKEIRDGVKCTDPFGNQIKVLLDLGGVKTDLCEASDAMDSYKHRGVAGCNLCSFCRLDK